MTTTSRRAGRVVAVLLTAGALALSTAAPIALAAPSPGPNPNANPNATDNKGKAKGKGDEKRSNKNNARKGGASGGAGSSGAGTGSEQSNGFPGTIKIAFPGDGAGPNNDPKPGCVVRLDFYGFRTGTYNVVFNSIAPTDPKQVASGSVTITQPRTPASRLQTSQRYTLDVSGLTPSKQGYHIKVRVTDPDKPGNGAKSKVFYFDCAPGGTTEFSGGGGSLTFGGGFGSGSGSGSASGTPRGGFATGAGGLASNDLPLLPLSGLLAGLGLLGAAGVARRRVTV